MALAGRAHSPCHRFDPTFCSGEAEISKQVQRSIQAFEQQTQTMPVEQRLLIKAIERQIHPTGGTRQPPAASSTALPADTRAMNLYALQQQNRLNGRQVEEILSACLDGRQLSEEKRRELGNAYTVDKVAWDLLDRQFGLEANAFPMLLRGLDDPEAIVCAAAARLLQGGKGMPGTVRAEAARKMMAILGDEELSRRPLDPPDYSRVWRLDDVLFDALRALVG
jgi:hypothetical protein